MSIVTILATNKYISVMTDGRIRDSSGILDENFVKFIRPNENTFIAFTGDVKRIQQLINECNLNNLNNYEDVTDCVYKKFLEEIGLSINNEKANNKISITIGGKDKNEEIGFYYFSNYRNKLTHVKPIEHELNDYELGLSRLFLANTEYGIETLMDSLVTVIGYDTVDKAVKIQEIVHDFQVMNDITVNSKKYRLAIEKTNNN